MACFAGRNFFYQKPWLSTAFVLLISSSEYYLTSIPLFLNLNHIIAMKLYKLEDFNRKKISGLCILSLLTLTFLSSCGPKQSLVKQSYFDLYLKDSIPYSLASHEKVSDKLFIFLPPALDTVQFEQTDLYRKIYKSGYDILCIYQPPAEGDKFYTRKALDFKGQHIQNAQNLISHLRKERRIANAEHTILFGIEQGAYMLPLLMANNNVDTAIFLNASPFSMYLSLQRIANGKVAWTPQRQNYLKRKLAVDSLDVLKAKLDDIESLSSDQYSLGKYSNMYWLSYHANYMLDEYTNTPGHCFWIAFDDYPLFKQSDWEYLKLLDKTKAKSSGTYRLLTNYNSFSDENWEEIGDQILPLLKAD